MSMTDKRKREVKTINRRPGGQRQRLLEPEVLADCQLAGELGGVHTTCSMA